MKLEQLEWTRGELLLNLSGEGRRLAMHFPLATLRDFQDGERVLVKGTGVELCLNYRTGALLWSGQHSSLDFLSTPAELVALVKQLRVSFQERLKQSVIEKLWDETLHKIPWQQDGPFQYSRTFWRPQEIPERFLLEMTDVKTQVLGNQIRQTKLTHDLREPKFTDELDAYLLALERHER